MSSQSAEVFYGLELYLDVAVLGGSPTEPPPPGPAGVGCSQAGPPPMAPGTPLGTEARFFRHLGPEASAFSWLLSHAG